MLNKAMIMAAGVGSRLGALSSIVPKPLVPVANIPTLDILVKHIRSFGIEDIILNTHYKADMISEYYKNDSRMTFIKEENLSGTAGGVSKCRFFFDKDSDFAVMSGDGLTDVNLKEAYESHKSSGAIATLVIKNIKEEETHKYGIIVPKADGSVDCFQEKPSVEEAKSTLANTGIYIFKYDIFKYIPENTFYDFAKNVFPALMHSGEKINTYETKGYWSDIGSIEQYKQSSRDVISGKLTDIGAKITKSPEGRYICDESTETGENVSVDDSVIGKNCRIGNNCVIKNSIIWDDVIISDDVTIENSIVLTGAKIETSCKDSVIEPRIKELTL